MPTRPSVKGLKTNGAKGVADIFEAIRNDATANYRDYVPPMNPNASNIREIGAIIMDMPVLKNEFLNALVNRIALVLITSKAYSNPWQVLKKGKLELGETIENVYVNITKPFQYDPAVAEKKVFERNLPDVRASFHTINYQKFYKIPIEDAELELALLSWEGIRDLIAKIVETVYTSANLDEYLAMKYLLCKSIVNGRLYPKQIQTLSPQNMRGIAARIKGVSNDYEFMKTTYNIAGVANFSIKRDQYLICTTDFDAEMDVEVLASAFHMERAEFMGHRILIDSFSEFDEARLAELFKDDPNYVPFTAEEKASLEKVPAVLVDKDWFMIFDKLERFTENFNGEGMYWNYFYHVWKIISANPFENAVVFNTGTPAVDSVTVSPETATVMAGQSILLSATVTTEDFASKVVNWTCEGVEGATIDIYGNLTVPADATGTITVTATSAFDPTKSAIATITIA